MRTDPLRPPAVVHFKRLKAQEEENAKLRKHLAGQMLDAAAMRELLAKVKACTPLVRGHA